LREERVGEHRRVAQQLVNDVPAGEKEALSVITCLTSHFVERNHIRLLSSLPDADVVTTESFLIVYRVFLALIKGRWERISLREGLNIPSGH